MTAAVVAVLAAACFALSTVAQHRAASSRDAAPYGGVRLLLHLCRRPLWLAGVLGGTVGLLLQGVAVSIGSLVVVQPLLVTGLLIALPLGVLVERRRPPKREWGAALAVVVGLTAFLLAAAPHPGRAVAAPGPLLVVTALIAVGTALAVVVAHTWGSSHRAALLGLAGGSCFGVLGALLKQVIGQGLHSPLGLVTTWPLYGLLAAGAAGMVLAQASYQAGSLAASQPALTIAEPVVAAAMGALAFGERLASSPPAVAGQLLGAVVMVVGVIALSALNRTAAPPPTPPPQGARAGTRQPARASTRHPARASTRHPARASTRHPAP